MEGRSSRGRGGSGKRGGNSSDSFGGEHRGRGRGGLHRGRGRRDPQRGRGRGGSSNAAEFHHRDGGEEENPEEESGRMGAFSRRKLESNWDRYEESERQEAADDDVPTQRGADYHILLESAGDSFTQFRFSEEKDWRMNSFDTSQIPDLFVDLPALADCLQHVPLHQRLNLEAELVQVSTPVELPTMSLASKQELPKKATFTPTSGALKELAINQKFPVATKPVLVSDDPQVSSSAAESLPVGDDDDDDDELDQLLTLEKPVFDVSANQSVSVPGMESAVPEKACEEVKEKKTEAAEDVTNHKSAPVRKELTEEDLEDWLDSMIS